MAFSLHKLFTNDEPKENEGVFLQYGKTDDGRPVRIRIARAGGSNKKYKKALEKAARPFRKAIDAGLLDEATGRALMIGVYAETIILGWENIEGPDGVLIPFSKENVIKLMNDLPDLFLDIQEQSVKVSVFRDEEREDIVKNSGTSSSTGSSKDQ